MGLTAYKVWASGDILTAADMNAYVRDNGRWLAADVSAGGAYSKPMFRFYKIATQTGITSGDALTLDGARFTTAGNTSVSSNSHVDIGLTDSGVYLIGANVRFNATYPGSAGGNFALTFKANGATTIAVADGLAYDAAGAKNHYAHLSTAWRFVNGDYFELLATFTSLTSVDLVGGSERSPDVWGVWIGKG